jgi:alkylation response protein AidB-like acyl-CoA dehydrogenase
MFRLMKPQRYDGRLVTMRELVTITEALGAVDGPTACAIGMSSFGAWLAGHMSQRAQDEIFGADPEARFAGDASAAPAEWVTDGLVVSGRWPLARGARRATWVYIGVAVGDEDDKLRLYFCLVPASELATTRGLTGDSRAFVADDVFVPQHRILAFSSVAKTRPGTGHESSAYRLPWEPVAELGMACGPMLGIGQAALDLTMGRILSIQRRTNHVDRHGNFGAMDVQFGRAALKIRTARLHVYGAADDLDQTAYLGVPATREVTTRVRADCRYAAQLVLSAVIDLVAIHGPDAVSQSNALQHLWRDASVIAGHAGVNTLEAYRIYGEALLAEADSDRSLD